MTPMADSTMQKLMKDLRERLSRIEQMLADLTERQSGTSM
jgi:hypothetical protein